MSYQPQVLRIGGRWVIARSADSRQEKRKVPEGVRFVLLTALALALVVVLEVSRSPVSFRFVHRYPWFTTGPAEAETWELVP